MLCDHGGGGPPGSGQRCCSCSSDSCRPESHRGACPALVGAHGCSWAHLIAGLKRGRPRLCAAVVGMGSRHAKAERIATSSLRHIASNFKVAHKLQAGRSPAVVPVDRTACAARICGHWSFVCITVKMVPCVWMCTRGSRGYWAGQAGFFCSTSSGLCTNDVRVQLGFLAMRCFWHAPQVACLGRKRLRTAIHGLLAQRTGDYWYLSEEEWNFESIATEAMRAVPVELLN